MAAGGKPCIQDAIECAKCIQVMVDPRNLGCGHTLCLKCLKSLILQNNINCPTCRSDTPIGAKGVNGLPKNFAIITLTTAMSQQQLPETTSCAACSALLSGYSDDEWFCKQCGDNFCQSCAKVHSETQIFDGHELVSLATINGMKCPLHLGKEQTHICINCDVAVCSTCVIINHPRHQLEEAKKYLETCEQELAVSLVQLKVASESVTDCVKNIDVKKFVTEVGQRFARIQNNIDTLAEERIREIREEQTNLKDKLFTDKQSFDKLLAEIKKAKLVKLKMYDICLKHNYKITAPQEALNNFNHLTLDICGINHQIEVIQNQLTSFHAMQIPNCFTVSHRPFTTESVVGTIHRTTEIQPGVEFNILGKQASRTLSLEKNYYPGVLGFSFVKLKGASFHINQITPDGPGASVGNLKMGDEILAVNGKNICEMNPKEVQKMIQGISGLSFHEKILGTGGTVNLTVRSCPEVDLYNSSDET